MVWGWKWVCGENGFQSDIEHWNFELKQRKVLGLCFWFFIFSSRTEQSQRYKDQKIWAGHGWVGGRLVLLLCVVYPYPLESWAFWIFEANGCYSLFMGAPRGSLAKEYFFSYLAFGCSHELARCRSSSVIRCNLGTISLKSSV